MTLLICPNCASRYELACAVQEEYARKFDGLLPKFPSEIVGPLILYLRLHKPEKSLLSWKKAYKLSAELLPPIQSARVERNGIVKVAPVELWAACMEQLVDDPPKSIRLPLKGHGYLLEIVSAQAERQAAQAEEKVEQTRRRATTPEQRSQAAQEQGLKRLSELTKDWHKPE